MRTLRLLPFAASVIAVPLLASCSTSVEIGGPSFNKEAFEEKAISEMNDDYKGIGHTVSSYECEYPEKIEEGSEFTCVADVGGAKVRTLINVTDDKGSFKLSAEDIVYDMQYAAKQLAQPVADQLGGSITVNCGSEVVALAPGSTFTCQVTDDAGAIRELTYTVTEGGANDSWKIN